MKNDLIYLELENRMIKRTGTREELNLYKQFKPEHCLPPTAQTVEEILKSQSENQDQTLKESPKIPQKPEEKPEEKERTRKRGHRLTHPKKLKKRGQSNTTSRVKNSPPFPLYFFQQAGTELCSVPCLESLDSWQ